MCAGLERTGLSDTKCLLGCVASTIHDTRWASVALRLAERQRGADPIFLAVVGVHILLGLACTVTGAIAMPSQKRAGRHPRYDYGKQLPVWKELPHFTYWLLPLAVGIPLIVRALLCHPPARQTSSP
jgi:hypothetical protein